ncbi:hypothetical protein CANCADRAFT_32932 [Tortispora caseinolytica NRRL Y-17796]|uniref:Topoisomerase I damage affected protein 2 n=1 Tax=Tortispora caseinolytica NRRL Y-17796 TaxID=767744 RepID=A0A1E4TDQ1_9ASCO|nr:hypothetical protein CANCADRAFT_32932 [Tortispora caseinolytica NRRL Y-17796]
MTEPQYSCPLELHTLETLCKTKYREIFSTISVYEHEKCTESAKELSTKIADSLHPHAIKHKFIVTSTVIQDSLVETPGVSSSFAAVWVPATDDYSIFKFADSGNYTIIVMVAWIAVA